MKRFAAVLIFIPVFLMVAGAASVALAGELVLGGDFETGDFTGAWVHGAGNHLGGGNPAWADHDVVLDLPYGGNYSALLGFKYTPQHRDRFGFMYQDVSIPLNISRAALYFKFRQQGYDGNNLDPFTAEIRDLSDGTLATVVNFSFSEWNNQFKDSGWIDDDGVGPAGYDMTSYAGQSVRLYFYQENSFDNMYETWAFVDDVSLIFRKFVDLAVDGDGDDLFGDPGTGAGGRSAQSGEDGDIISYTLDIENEGLDSDSYVLSCTPPAGWTAVVRYGGTDYPMPWTTPVIAPGTTMQAEVLLTIPTGEPVGGYATILDAVSVSFGNRFDSVTLETNVVPADQLTDLAVDSNGFGVIDPEGGGGISYKEAAPDTTVTFRIDLLNSGVLADSFLVWFRPPAPLTAVIEEGAVAHSGAFTTGLLDPGVSGTYTLRVTVPSNLSGGDYGTFVYAKSLTDTLRKDGVRAVTRVRAPRVDIVICGSGEDIIDPTGSGLGGSSTVSGTRGNTVYFPIILQNEGGVADSFALDWSRPGGGWSAVINDGVSDHTFPWTTPTFEPFSGRSYVLAVTIPQNASYDTHVSILDAVSQADGNVTESVTAAVTVSLGNEVDLIIDGNGDDMYGALGSGLGGSSIRTADPGDTLFFVLTVENERGANVFDLEWNTPPGWEVVIGDSTSSLSGIGAGTYKLEVRIPAGGPGGTFDIIVDGWKSNKRFYVDSVRGRVFVNLPRIVDALVDGDGDEVFGAPGTGGGGFSEQGTIGGRTVNFTVELQNQGGAAESYVVTWNGFPGWSATLAGSVSPFTTAPVVAGGSALLPFEVVVPLAASNGDYDYIIDIVSTADSTNVESVNARVHINPPPMVDLVIDGNGSLDTAPAGTGEGGRAVVFGDPGIMATAVLEVINRGGFPDSFMVTWSEPDGWPAGSVLLSDGVGDYVSPFVTGVIDPGSSVVFTVKIFIPASAGSQSSFIIDGAALSSDLEDSILLEVLTTSFVTGFVFNDKNHDGALDPGENGWSGVTVTLSDPGGWMTGVTGAGGEYIFEAAAGLIRQIVERTPSGMISLSPDTVSLGSTSAGDTLRVDFADVPGPSIAPELDVSAPAGGFADLPHMVTAGTAGQASLTALLPAGWVEVFYRDNNGDGLLDVGDTRLTSGDLDLDPEVPGRDNVPVIIRVFIPPLVPAGTVETITISLSQTLSGTAVTAYASVVDGVTVLASASGMLNLVKEVDLAVARPGDVITYTITFLNPGAEGVREIEIIDPVSAEVDIVTDAFGPGQDITWIRDGSTVYLTADPSDADEAMFEAADGRLRVILSRQAPFTLESGAQGQVIYMVRIR